MTDKEKIRAEIERQKKIFMYDTAKHSFGRMMQCVDLLTFVDSLPEEPVSEELEAAIAKEEYKDSLWHNPTEEPRDREHCLLHYGGDKYVDFELVFYNAKQKCFITETYPHPTGYKVVDGDVVVEQFQNKRDRIPISDVKRWCKLSDLLPKKYGGERMTLNGLIKKAREISWMLTSGDIPLTMNGKPVEIVDITLEGSNGHYWADMKVVARKEE